MSGKTENPVGNEDQSEKLQGEEELIKHLNDEYANHSVAVNKAIEDEKTKAKVAEELTGKLNTEKEALDKVSESAEKAASSGGKMGGITKSMELGKFTAQVKEIDEKIKALRDKPQALIDNFQKLQDAQAKMSSATTDKARNEAYKEYSTILDAIRSQLSAETQEERNLADAIRGTLGVMREVKAVEDGVGNSSFANDLKKKEEAVRALNEVSPSLAQNMTNLRTALTAMEEATAKGDRDAMVRAYESWQTAMKGVTSALGAETAAEKAATAAKKEEEAAAKRQQTEENKRQTQLGKISSLLTQCANAEKKYAGAKDIPALREQYEALRSISPELEKVRDDLNSGRISADQAAAAVNKLNTSFKTCTGSMSTAGGVLKNWWINGLDQLKSRMTYTVSLVQIVTKVTQEIKQMVNTAVELDTAMNNLQIVTRASASDMEAYGKRVSAMAKETAQSTKDLIDATTVYARLGYNMDESAVLSKYTAMLQGVGDIEAGAAQDAMTAIIKAFGVDVDNIESIMDKLVLVGNNFPISVSQIAEGMNNAGSMLAVAGNSFEESVALLTAANTTIQNISKASTGLRTIAARIRKMDTEDGEIIEESKYNDMIDALTRHNVKLVDANGEYRKTYDIIKDIAAVWKDMSTMQQAAVVEALAGTRQQNIFASLMTQFGEAEKAVEQMKDSAGELQEAYDIRMNSIASHVQILKDAFNELSMDFVDSNLAKAVVDGLARVIEVLDLLIEKFGVVKTALGAIAAVAAGRFFKLLISGEIVAALKGLISTFALLQADAAAAGVSTFSAFLAMIPTLVSPATAALAALAAAIAAIAIASKIHYNNSLEGLSEKAEEERKNLKSLQDQYETNTKKINELNEAKSHGDFSTEQQTELNNLESQNKLLEAQIELLKRRNAEASAEQYKKAKEDAETLLGDGEGSTSEALRKYEKLKKRYELHPTKMNKGVMEEWETILNNRMQQYDTILSVLDDELDSDLRDRILGNINDITSAVTGIPTAVLEARDELKKMQAEGNVDLLNRPVINAEALKRAGWEGVGEGGATVYTSTYSNAAGNVAMNFTPILVDENNNPIGVLTPDQLQRYAEEVIDGSREDDLKLRIGSVFEGRDAIDQANEAAETIHKDHEQIYKDDLKQVERFNLSIKKLSKGTLDALLSGTKDLTAEQMREIDNLGFSVEDLAKQLHLYSVATDNSLYKVNGLDGAIVKQVGDLTSLKDELADATAALEKYKKAMEGGEKGDAVKEMADIYKSAMEDLQSGRIDSNKVHNAAELLLGQDRMAELNYDLEAIARELSSDFFQNLFDPKGESKQSYGQRFAKYIEDNVEKFAKAGAAVEKTIDGYTFHYENIEKLAEAFGMSREACIAFLNDLDAYGVEVMESVESMTELAQIYKDMEDNAGGAKGAVEEFIKYLAEAGRDSLEIKSILENLSKQGVISLRDDEVNEVLKNTMKGLQDIDSENANPTIDADASNAYSTFRSVVDWVNYINSLRATVTIDTPNGTKTGTATSVPTASTSADTARRSRAQGGVTGKAGPTLVNELGAELISDRGSAFIANHGQPGFVNLSKDAIVFTAEQTRRILNGSMPGPDTRAYAQGTRKDLIGRLTGSRDVPAKVASSWVCKACGSRNDKSATVCWKCKVPKGMSRTTAVAQGSSNNSSSSNSSSSSNTYTWTCGICGATNSSNRSSCWDCGFVKGSRMEQFTEEYIETNVTPAVSTPSTSTPRVTQQNYYCPNCGYTIQKNYTGNCPHCGQYLKNGEKAVDPKKQTKVDSPQSYNYDNLFSYASSGAGGGTGGGGVGSADSQSKSNPQKIDWIAVKLNRIQRAISDLDAVASSGLKNLSTRLSAATSETSKLNEEITASQQGYNRYIQEANSVGLRSDLAEKVRNGTIDINKYDDEDLRQKIQEYQEWYEKALQCSSAVEQLNQQIGALYKQNFELVQQDYANQLSLIEHEMNMINKGLSMAQAKGMLDSAAYYERLATQQRSSISKLKSELSALESYFSQAMNSGKIQENSEEWYAMKQEILGAKEAIADANVQLQEYSKTIRDINWSYFDYAHEQFAMLTQETNFLIGLMGKSKLFDERGQFNDTGFATVGMHVINFDSYMAQADEYAKEMQKIERQMANDPYNTELIARRNTLLQLQQQSISAAEQEKQTVKSLVAEGIQIELDSLKELIQTYKDNIDAAKDLYEYQKRISEKTENIASIQKQLAAYSGDTSEESRAKVQRLNKDLEKAQKDLAETENDRSISETKKILDDVYDEYEELMNKRLDNVDLLMKEMVDASNANSAVIQNEIKNVASQVGYSITSELQTAMNGSYANYDRVFSGIAGATEVLNKIYSTVSAMAAAAGAVKAYAKGGLIDYTGLAAVHGTPANPEMVLSAADTEKFLQAAQMMNLLQGGTIGGGDIGASVVPSGGGMNIGEVILDIDIDHVENYDDFVKQLQADPKFEKMIDAMTMGRMLGGSKLAKNSVRF